MEECYHLRIKAIIRNKEGEILLLQVNKATLKQYTGSSYWDLPGGRVQRGEKVEETLRRELFEETGIMSSTQFFRQSSSFFFQPVSF